MNKVHRKSIDFRGEIERVEMMKFAVIDEQTGDELQPEGETTRGGMVEGFRWQTTEGEIRLLWRAVERPEGTGGGYFGLVTGEGGR